MDSTISRRRPVAGHERVRQLLLSLGLALLVAALFFAVAEAVSSVARSARAADVVAAQDADPVVADLPRDWRWQRQEMHFDHMFPRKGSHRADAWTPERARLERGSMRE